MSNAARLTGHVLKVETRSGFSTKTNKEWSMTTARVLVAGEDICDVGIPDNYLVRTGHEVAAGDDVDLLVSVRASGGFLNIDAVKPWPVKVQGLSTVPSVAAAK